ncbi:MAG: DUF2868 domain-containing protein [Proteobacteria bacterium]|nr:DUF2868 domain-containing protein [Pseudomonadota bacterium]
MRLTDFVVVEFARAWQQEHRASVVDPEIVAEVAADPAYAEAADDDARMLLYCERLLQRRVDDDDGPGIVHTLQVALTAAWWIAPLAGLLLGGALLEASLPPNDVRPVNVFVVLGEGVLIPALFLTLTLLATLSGGRIVQRLHWIRPVLALLGRKALSTPIGRLGGRVLKHSGAAGPTLASLSHLLWLGALGAMLVVAAFRFTFDDYLFCWSSTLPITGDGVEQLFGVLAAPVQWLPGVDAPTAEQVTVSQYASLGGTWPRGTGDAVQDDALRKAWYALLLAVIAFWGVLPRIVGLVVSRVQSARGIDRALARSSIAAVLPALAAHSTLRHAGTSEGPRDELPPTRVHAPAAARAGEGLDLITFAADAPEPGILDRLGWNRLGLSGVVRAVEDDDDAVQAASVLESLTTPATAPGGAIVVFDLADTPGRVREAFLRDVVQALGRSAPVHVLLTGASAFKMGPRASAFAGRLGAWRDMAERAGVPSASVRPDEGTV